MKFKAYAPAKINLGLEIISKRDDGYHNVDMIMQTIDLFDEVTIEKTKDKKIRVINNKIPNCPEKNDIAFKCAEIFFEESRIFNTGIKIRIKKNIPISAGLAGGSSDGAATLLILNEMHGNFFSTEMLCELGEKIGADIPFCILGGTVRATGKGTTLKKLHDFGDYFIVLVKPEISVCTGKAYSLFDLKPPSERKNFDSMERALTNSDFEGLSSLLFNRFEELSAKKEVFEIKKELINLGASSALMSGSGPSVYGIFKDEISAKKCYEEMKKNHSQVFFCRPNCHGAEII